MKASPSYLGLDTGKKHLHLGSPDQCIDVFDNTPAGSKAAGHRQLIQRLATLKPTCVAIEASNSGGGRLRTRGRRGVAGCPFRGAARRRRRPRLPPEVVRHFAKSAKVLAKTDAIDATLIARFARAYQPQPTPKSPESTRKLRALRDRRQQIIEDRVREENRLEACAHREVIKQLKASIKRLKAQEKKLDALIQKHIHADEKLHAKAAAMTAVKGVGEQTANTLLACLPEPGTLNRQQAAPRKLPSSASRPTPANRGPGKANAASTAAAPRSAEPSTSPPSPPHASARS